MADLFSSPTDSDYFNLTIDDTSPTISYLPFADTFGAVNIIGSWNPFFTDPNSGFATPSTLGLTGQGTSLHETAADGGKLSMKWNGFSPPLAPKSFRWLVQQFDGNSNLLSIDAVGGPCVTVLNGTKVTLWEYPVLTLAFFPGTAVHLFGHLIPGQDNSASYSVALDGVSRTDFFSSQQPTPGDPSTEILASFSNLTYGAHTIELTMHNPNQVSSFAVLLQFDHAIIETRLPPPFPASNDTSVPASAQSTFPPLFVRDIPDDSLVFRGQWSFQRGIIQNSATPFHTSTNIGDRASLSFNGTAIAIEGFTSPVSGSYNVVLDNDTPVQISAHSSFNASTPSVLYYRTGLDPNVLHDLEIVNAGAVTTDVGSFLAISKMSVVSTQQTSAPASSPPPALSGGSIAAIAVGSSVAFLLVIAIAVWFLRRRRARKRKRSILVNPRFNALRRLSFFPASLFRHSAAVTEKDAEANTQRREGGGVLDIRPPPSDTDDDPETTEEHHGVVAPIMALAGDSRTSQNSDGSFSIDLPELPPRGYVHVRTSESQPSPSSISHARRASSPPLASPTTRPRGPRDMHASLPPILHDSARGILLPEERSPAADADVETALIPPVDTSPLRVNFEDEPRETSKQRRESRYTSTGGMSLPLSLRAALTGYVPATVEPGSPLRERSISGSEPSTDPQHSFLDIESTKDPSVISGGNSHSNSTPGSRASRASRSSTRSRPGDRGSSHSVPSVPSIPDQYLPDDRRRSLGFFMPFGRGPSSSHPSRSPNISLEPITITSPSSSTPPRLSLSVPEDATPPEAEHPHTVPTDFVPSPTDSIPATVSDIHFRHSSLSTFSQVPESRRGSSQRLSASRPAHPPLPSSPGMQQVENRPFIVQKLLGMAPVGGGPFTPYSSPTTPGFGFFGPRSPSASPPPVAGPSRLPDTPPVAGPSRLPDSPPVAGPSRLPQTPTSPSTPTGRSISFRTTKSKPPPQ